MSKSSGFSYGWVVVGAGAMMTCVGFGAMLSLAVFLQPISEAMGWSRSGASAAATIDFLCMGLAAFFWGAQFLRTDDGGRERLDRRSSQPRGRAGVGRHGRGAADGRAVRELDDHNL